MIAVSLKVGGGVRLIKPAKLCMCTQNTTNTTRTDARRRVCAAMVPYRWATRGTSLRELEYIHTRIFFQLLDQWNKFYSSSYEDRYTAINVNGNQCRPWSNRVSDLLLHVCFQKFLNMYLMISVTSVKRCNARRLSFWLGLLCRFYSILMQKFC